VSVQEAGQRGCGIVLKGGVFGAGLVGLWFGAGFTVGRNGNVL
jgi:hypothetical protein